MDEVAHAVHVIEADQALSSELPCQRHWHTLIVVALDDFEKVHAENLEHHHEVLPVRAVVDEGVKKLDAVRCFSAEPILVK